MGARLHPYLFLLYSSLSALSYALVSVIVKRSSELDPAQLSLVANCGAACFILPRVVGSRGRLGLRGSRRITLLTALLTAAGLSVRFHAYRYIPLGEAAVINCTTPLGVALVARLLLKETLGLVQAGAVLVAITGVLVSVRTPELFGGRTHYGWKYFVGVGSAFLSTLCFSFGVVLQRKLKHVHYSIRVLLIAVLSVLLNVLALGALGPPDRAGCGLDSLLMVVMGLLTCLAECFFVASTQVGKAALVSLVKSSMDVVFAMLLQLIFFLEVPDAYNLCGAALVLFAIAVIALRQWLNSLPEGSATKRTLSFVLI